jgi:hypothetical protein
MPTIEGEPDWINIYAGKWYKRQANNLPNPTEVLSLHLEYFTSPDDLLLLAKHDMVMTKFIAFILMGGPVAAFEAISDAKKQKALDQIYQASRRGSGYTRSYGGRGSRGGGGSNYVPKPKDKKFGV